MYTIYDVQCTSTKLRVIFLFQNDAEWEAELEGELNEYEMVNILNNYETEMVIPQDTFLYVVHCKGYISPLCQRSNSFHIKKI